MYKYKLCPIPLQQDFSSFLSSGTGSHDKGHPEAQTSRVIDIHASNFAERTSTLASNTHNYYFTISPINYEIWGL